MNHWRQPDFIIAGAPRSGTSWLYHLLDNHPMIYMAKPIAPEPKFFLIDEIYEKGLDYYRKTWFSDIEDAKICGEKSTNYLENSSVASRIHHNLPAVKLIFILRNPVERAYSNYLWSCMNGLEDQDFATALELESKRELEVSPALRYSRPHAYFSRGLYAKMLKPYFQVFDREEILCLRYEDIAEKLESLAKRVCSFLGVPPDLLNPFEIGIINPSQKKGAKLSSDTRNKLIAAYREPCKELSQLLGPEFQLWENN